MNGWLVNDYLQTMKGTKTWWHYMLEWFPLEDKTGFMFDKLPDEIEKQASNNKPDFLIRNASYFRKMNIDTYTISLLQDIAWDPTQKQVLESSDLVIANSEYTLSFYPYLEKTKLIPIGVDFDLFKPMDNKDELRKKWKISENSICFIGAAYDIKGWRYLTHIIENTPQYNYVLVMKDNENPKIATKNWQVFHSVSHEKLVEIINCCSVGICTSEMETQHLAGIEMGACGVPILSTNVGVYWKRKDDEWGCQFGDPVDCLEKLMNSNLNPRKYWLEQGYDLEPCKKAWSEVIENVSNLSII